MRILLLGLLIWGAPLWAEGERAGRFDYYVLSLSWSPTWCALEGDARGADQCDDRHDFGWTLHGLWPQNERGWPSYCRTVERDPSRGQTKAMADIMGSGGLAWHQWKKHGRCSGLSSDAYFEISRRAYASLTRPAVFRKLKDPVKLPAKVIEEAFLESNPRLSPDMITITCKNRRIQEVRLCLNKDLEPRTCGKDVNRDCSMKDALFAPIR
ncbi:ribonuclease T2 [Litoreibacter halocynthiae]|uniref:Ribonuclease T2 n=1 Tax=Litoreibacter halocynthiae TaxID=1242689 RepID=A0A4R7LEL6_9RHOB|nr:ribonuclease T2 [Litoreibacter halocynthiae]TDT74083.1 ribonuclease T2 [Litoreibacter halocynthiae]